MSWKLIRAGWWSPRRNPVGFCACYYLVPLSWTVCVSLSPEAHLEVKIAVYIVNVGDEAKKHQQRSGKKRKQPIKGVSSSKLPLLATGTKSCWVLSQSKGCLRNSFSNLHQSRVESCWGWGGEALSPWFARLLKPALSVGRAFSMTRERVQLLSQAGSWSWKDYMEMVVSRQVSEPD